MTSVKIKYIKNAFKKLRYNLINRSVTKTLFCCCRKIYIIIYKIIDVVRKNMLIYGKRVLRKEVKGSISQKYFKWGYFYTNVYRV